MMLDEPPVEMHVREAAPADVAAIAELIRQLGYPSSIDEIEQRMLYATSDAIGRVLVATANEKVVAVATLYHIRTLHRPADICRITAFVVDEHVRGSGIGRLLIAEIERHARDSGCERIEVTSAGQRTGAHAFYDRLGYREWPKRFIKDLP